MLEQRHPSGTISSPSIRYRMEPFLKADGLTFDNILIGTQCVDAWVAAPVEECINLLDDRLRRVSANEGFNLQFLRDPDKRIH